MAGEVSAVDATHVHWSIATLSAGQIGLILFFSVVWILSIILESSRVYLHNTKTEAEIATLEATTSDNNDLESRGERKTSTSFVADIYQASHDKNVVALYRSFALLGAILLYFYVCEETEVVPSIGRHYERDFFAFFMIVIALWALPTLREAPDDKLLGRDQTEEWKGWMQIGFLAYHYFHAKETYNMIRVFIASYVWMTGFGHFSYFWLKDDFSLTRLSRMIWRLNFTVTFVCLALKRAYMLYYICAMHTFWFLSVYIMMWFQHRKNKTHPIFMHTKLVIYFLLCLILFNTRHIFPLFDTLFYPFQFLLAYENKPGQGASLHEWFFRTRLDHFATLVGMLSAYFYPNYEAWLKRVESQPKARQWVTKGSLAVILAFALAMWWQRCLMIPDKYSYNNQHPYTSMIPVLIYIALRNLTPTLRSYYLHGLTFMGRITLETYIAQFHGIMKHNAREVIDYLPGYPKVNILIGSAIFVLVSYCLFKITIRVSTILLVRDTPQLLSNLTVIGVTAFIFYWIGLGLSRFAIAFASNAGVVLALVEFIKMFAIMTFVLAIALYGVRSLFQRLKIQPTGALKVLLFS